MVKLGKHGVDAPILVALLVVAIVAVVLQLSGEPRSQNATSTEMEGVEESQGRLPSSMVGSDGIVTRQANVPEPPSGQLLVQAYDLYSNELVELDGVDPTGVAEIAEGILHVPMDSIPGSLTLRAQGYASTEFRMSPADFKDGLLRVPMSKSLRLVGRVTNEAQEALAGVRVELSLATQPSLAERVVATDEQGEFAFDGVREAAPLRLECTLEGYCPDTWEGSLLAGQDPLGFELQRGLILSGKATFSTGSPLDRGRIRFEPLDSGPDIEVSSKTRLDGSFVVTGLREGGNYTLVACSSRPTRELLRLPYQAQDAFLEVTIPSLESIRGRVVDSEGAAIPGIDVSVSAGHRVLAAVLSDAQGGFEFRDIPSKGSSLLISASSNPYDSYRWTSAIHAQREVLLRLAKEAGSTGLRVLVTPQVRSVRLTSRLPGLSRKFAHRTLPATTKEQSIALPAGPYLVEGLGVDSASLARTEVWVQRGQWTQIHLVPGDPARLVVLHESETLVVPEGPGGADDGSVVVKSMAPGRSEFEVRAPWSGQVRTGNCTWPVALEAGKNKTLDLRSSIGACEAKLVPSEFPRASRAILLQRGRMSVGQVNPAAGESVFSFQGASAMSPGVWACFGDGDEVQFFTGSNGGYGVCVEPQPSRESLVVVNGTEGPLRVLVALLAAGDTELQYGTRPGFTFSSTALASGERWDLAGLPAGRYRIESYSGERADSVLARVPDESEVVLK